LRRWTTLLLRLLLGLMPWACALWGTAAHAQALESALSPGKLAAPHVKWEDECGACHVRFDRAGQDRLCADCHKDVGRDIRQRTGYHGRLPAQACRSCHTDHRGRDARIIALDPKRFDHAQTDYALRGRHAQVPCASCHLPKRQYREAPADCAGCHRKDDPHKGALGAACGDCHGESDWKSGRFDHATTAFSLTGQHAQARCADCHHTPGDYKGTPRACIACHRKDDDGPSGHHGRFGDKCASCHSTRAWKPAEFQHDTDTRFALRGRHRTAACTDCHTASLKARVPSECHGCHQQDDKHKGSLGSDCAACHSERSWKERSRFDHDKTLFPLLGEHLAARCEACHKTPQFKEVSRECVACHRSDDRHAGTLGEDCGTCHRESDWKNTSGRFEHDRTRFRLRRSHAAPLACSACHADAKSLRGTPLACASCHARHDRHEGQLGRQCGECHDDGSWKVAGFNHSRTRFALVGRHAAVACKGCHETPRFKDVRSDCGSCHRRDDAHRGTLGTRCDSCHNARAWALWSFDHGKRTRWPLTGGHGRTACDACHRVPAPAGRDAAALSTACVACHRKDDTHEGTFGASCERCHATDHWKRLTSLGARP